MRDRLSIIIPTMGRPGLLRTLDAVLDATEKASADVIVVVDGPQGSPPCDRPVRWLSTGAPSGGGRARNLGAASANGDILVFIDDDVHPGKGALATLRETIGSGADAVSATVQPSPDVTDNAYVRFAYGGAAHGGGDDGREPWWHFCTSLAMVRRDMFERVGGFDERFPDAGYEDVELAYRIARQDGVLGTSSEAVAWHRRQMDRSWYIDRCERQGAKLALLLSLQPGLGTARHQRLEHPGFLRPLVASVWLMGRWMLPAIERLPGPVAWRALAGIHACALMHAYAAARRQYP